MFSVWRVALVADLFAPKTTMSSPPPGLPATISLSLSTPELTVESLEGESTDALQAFLEASIEALAHGVEPPIPDLELSHGEVIGNLEISYGEMELRQGSENNVSSEEIIVDVDLHLLCSTGTVVHHPGLLPLSGLNPHVLVEPASPMSVKSVGSSEYFADYEFSPYGKTSTSSGKVSTRGRYKWLIAVAFVLVSVLGALVPSIYFAFAGSSVAFRNYVRKLTPEAKSEVAEALLGGHAKSSPKSNTAHVTKRPFSGVCYSPSNMWDAGCTFTREDVALDLALLSSVTDKIRTYSTQCGQAEYILHAIQSLNIDMKLALGVWVGSNSTHNGHEIQAAKALLKAYPPLLFESVFVGNEVLLREELSEVQLTSHIEEMRSFVSLNGLQIPVGTCEEASHITESLSRSCDVIGVNILPLFAGLEPEDGARWAADYLESNILPQTNTTVVISEIGWPYDGGNYFSASADPASYQRFMNAWVCEESRRLNVSWYYFEAFDEPWKKVFHEGARKWETEWGVFGPLREIKPFVNFPSC